jgi:predicted nucleic acid-binding protein
MPISSARRAASKRPMYLVDTNVVSEARKKARANPGVARFFKDVNAAGQTLYLSAITVGELRRGVELIRHRGDIDQAELLEGWLTTLLAEFANHILEFETEAAQLWGRLSVPDPSHALDKQIAAIGLVNDLTIVTRNLADFRGTGVRVRNPFVPV